MRALRTGWPARRPASVAPLTAATLVVGMALIGTPSAAAAQSVQPSHQTSVSEATNFEQNAAHTGIQTDDIALPLARSWSADPGPNTSYPLIAAGRVYVTSGARTGPDTSSTVSAHDLTTGALDWSTAFPTTFGSSVLTYDEGELFDVASSGVVSEIDPVTGRVGWSTDLVSPGGDLYELQAPPTASGGRLFVPGNEKVTALSEQTGAVLWQTDVDDGYGSAPAVSGSLLYVQSGLTGMTAVDTSTGAIVWGTSLNGDRNSMDTTPPAVVAGTVWGSESQTGTGLTFGASHGNVLRPLTSDSTPIVDGSSAYLLDADDSNTGLTLESESTSTGRLNWTFGTGDDLEDSAVMDGGLLYVSSRSGHLYAVNTHGQLVWSGYIGSSFTPNGFTGGMAAAAGVIALASGDDLTVMAPTKGHATPGAAPTPIVTTTRSVDHSVPSGQAPDFRSFQGNGRHDGDVRERLRAPLNQTWHASVGGVPSYPVVGDGYAVVTVRDPQTQATLMEGFALSGRLAWGPIDVGPAVLGAAYDRGRIFVDTHDGVVEAYAVATGTLDWITQLPRDVNDTSTQPVAADGRLYVTGDGDGGVLELLRESTGLTERAVYDDFGDNPPAVTANRLLVTDNDTLLDLNPTTLEARSASLLNEVIAGTVPQVNRGSVWSNVDSGDDGSPTRETRVALSTGSASTSTDSTQTVASVVEGHHTVTYQVNGAMLRSRTSGRPHASWVVDAGARIAYSPLVTRNVVVVATVDGTVLAYDRTTGRLLSTRNVGALSWPVSNLSDSKWVDTGTPQGLAAANGELLIPGGDSLTAFR